MELNSLFILNNFLNNSNNIAAENIQRFNQNSALRPQHQQHNKFQIQKWFNNNL